MQTCGWQHLTQDLWPLKKRRQTLQELTQKVTNTKPGNIAKIHK